MSLLEPWTFGLEINAIASFALASLLIELTPGPNMTWLAMVTLVEGRDKGLAALLGIALGLALVGVAAALGVAAIVTNSQLAWEILRWSGVAYLIWLAADGWRNAAAEKPDPGGQSASRYFRRGLISNLFNPKAAVFYVAMLPGFLPPDASPQQAVFLSMLYVLVATTVHAMVVLLAGTATPLLTNPAREQAARRISSLLLALVALWFAWKTAR